MTFNPQDTQPPGARIKVIGIGGGGTNAVSSMINQKIEGVEFISANTDVQSLIKALAPTKIQLGKELTKGLGAGADPDIGRDAALEDRHEIQEALSGADMVFITVGMGGGTGTGSAAVIAQIAQELGALTVAVVTKPFNFEGKRRLKHAETGIENLSQHVDTLLTIPNQRLLQIATPNLSMIDAFKMADDVLVNAVKGISDIINIPGTINVDFSDVRTIMSSMGQALMGIGCASGESRAIEAAKQAISSPLLEDVDIEGATGILINITAGKNISLLEINESCMVIQEAAHEDANIIFGAVVDENASDEIRVTVIATGFPCKTEDDQIRQEKAKEKMYSQMYQMKNDSLIRKPIRTSMNMRGKTAPAATVPTKQGEQTTQELKTNSFQFFKKEPAPAVVSANRPTPEPTPDQTETATPPSAPTPQQPESAPEPKEQEKQEEKPTPTFNFENQNQESLPKVDLNKEEPITILEEPQPQESSPQNDNTIHQDIDKKIDEALQLADRVNNMENKEDDLDVPAFIRQGFKDPNSFNNP